MKKLLIIACAAVALSAHARSAGVSAGRASVSVRPAVAPNSALARPYVSRDNRSTQTMNNQMLINSAVINSDNNREREEKEQERRRK